MKIGSLISGDTVLVARVHIATGPFERMRGLLGRDGLPPGEGMLLSPCRAVHTWFMRFPIDVVFLDSEWSVTKVCRDVRPFRMAAGGWRARHAVEVHSGWLTPDSVLPGTPTKLGV